MLDSIINKSMKYLNKFYQEYGINFAVQYNSDLDMLSQYSKSLNTRALFGKSDLQLISPQDLKALSKESHILMMYNYSPLRKVADRFNNINFEAVFDPRNPNGIAEISKYRGIEYHENPSKQSIEEGIEFFTVIRELNRNLENNFTVRDMLFGEIDFTCKFLTSSSKIINELQFLHIQKLQKPREIEMTFDFGGEIGRVDFPYTITFAPIDTIGHIDYINYGNLQEMTFTFSIQGPFFSSYSSKYPMMEGIDLTIGFTNK